MTTEVELQALVNATPGVSLLIDLEGTILCANLHSVAHFGIEMERLIGTNVYSLFDAATAAGRRAIVRQVELQRIPVVLEDERNGMHFRHSLVPAFDPDGVVRRVAVFAENITERKQYQKKLEEANRQLQDQLQENLALHAMLTEQTLRDPLTGLHNRRYLEETLPRELSRAKRVGYPMALIMVDLDHFKRVNDTYGHPTGDAVLKAMASILLHGAREGDIICRYGGEEFLVALPNMTIENALARAKVWQTVLGSTSITHGAFSIKTTLSAGISAFPNNGADIDTLLRLADEALYRAKANGRDRVEFDAMTRLPD